MCDEFQQYIGCQRIEKFDGDRAPYCQTRFWARAGLDAFVPEHEMIARPLSRRRSSAAHSSGART